MLLSIKTKNCINAADFRNLSEMHNHLGGHDLGESIDLLICGRADNFRLQLFHQNSNHKEFQAKNMEALCDFAEFISNMVDIYISLVPPSFLHLNGGIFFSHGIDRGHCWKNCGD